MYDALAAIIYLSVPACGEVSKICAKDADDVHNQNLERYTSVTKRKSVNKKDAEVVKNNVMLVRYRASPAGSLCESMLCTSSSNDLIDGVEELCLGLVLMGSCEIEGGTERVG